MSPESGASTGVRVARGVFWTYGAVITTSILQLGYAAFTSRAADQVAFGHYSIALTSAALVMLLANAGLGTAVTRRQDITGQYLRSLMLYCVTIGLVAAAVTWLTAPLWALVWGDEGIIPPLRLLSIAAFEAPALGLLTALGRRESKFARTASIVFASAALGFAVGAVAVMLRPSAASLVVSALVSQTFTVFTLAWTERSRLVQRGWHWREARDDIGYSASITGSRILAYFSGNAGKYGVNWALGASVLGQWNRAEVVSSIPLQQLQNAMTQAVSPEFRHDRRDYSRAQRVWPELLGMVAWSTWPLAALGAGVAGVLVPVILGPGWGQAATLVPALLLLGALQMVVMLLNSAVEVVGMMRAVWLGQVGGLMVQVAGGVAAFATESIWPAIGGAAAALALMHAVHLVAASMRGLVSLRVVAFAYIGPALVAVMLGLDAWALVREARAGSLLVLMPISTFVGGLAVAWVFRRRLPFVVIARRYGVLGKGSGSKPA